MSTTLDATAEIPRPRRARRPRRYETLCGECNELVGLVSTKFNNSAARVVWKAARHYRPEPGAGRCYGSGWSVPDGAVIEGPGITGDDE